MWKIQPVSKETYNCFQFLAATVARFFNCDYRLMMLELWGFLYDEKSGGTISDKLKLCWNYKTKKRSQLLSFHGLSFEIIASEKINTLQYIYDYFEQSPVAVFIDSFDCPWLPFYRKLHRPHALLITNKEIETFSFLDQYSSKSSVQEVATGFVESNTANLIVFTRNENELAFTLRDEIAIRLDEWEQYGFSHYEKFVSEMKNTLDISTEIYDNPAASKLIMHLKNLAEDRTNFIEALDLFEERLSIDLRPAKSSLCDIATNYEKLRAYIIKCAFSKRTHKPEIVANALDSIYLSEQKVYERIRVLVN